MNKSKIETGVYVLLLTLCIITGIAFCWLAIDMSFNAAKTPVTQEHVCICEHEIPEPIVITVYVMPTPTPEQESITEEELETMSINKTILTDEEIDLLALVTMAEAEGESDEGKRLVIDTILNRVDSPEWPDTVKDVVYQKGQFSSMWNGRVDRCYVMDDIRKLVLEELENRTNHDVMFFRMNHYHPYGTPLFKVGCHYFSNGE